MFESPHAQAAKGKAFRRDPTWACSWAMVLEVAVTVAVVVVVSSVVD